MRTVHARYCCYDFLGIKYSLGLFRWRQVMGVKAFAGAGHGRMAIITINNNIRIIGIKSNCCRRHHIRRNRFVDMVDYFERPRTEACR